MAAFAAMAVAGFAAAYIGPLGSTLAPSASADVVPVTLYASTVDHAQTLETSADGSAEPAALDRGNYSVYVAPKAPPAASAKKKVAAAIVLPFVTPDPGTAQAIAQQMLAQRGWGDDQFSCLVALWNRESGWRVNAYNPSGAYGIPQAKPGNKMASAGADWQTNPATQIAWGLGYISSRWGTPCGAWAHSNSVGWY